MVVKARAVELDRRVRGRLSPLALDALLVVGLFVLCVGPGHERWAHDDYVVFSVVLLLPLVWRRRAPLAVFGMLAFGSALQWLVDVQPIPADVGLLVALYTLAARSPWPHVALAGTVLEIGIWLAAGRWGPDGRVLVPVLFLSAVAAAVAVTGANVQLRRAHLASLEDRAVRLERERVYLAQLAVVEERARITREMHDIVTHNLSVVVALADAAVSAQFRSPGRATRAMQQISDTGRQALTDMRRSLGVLREDEPDAQLHPMPGVAQLHALVEQMRAAGLPIDLTVEGDPQAVPSSAQLTAYRLVQEALTNTLKHTPPGTSARVVLHLTDTAVLVEVTDDGSTDHTAAPRPGHGMTSMRERVAVYGGRLRVGPRPEGGWAVFAALDVGSGEQDPA